MNQQLHYIFEPEVLRSQIPKVVPFVSAPTVFPSLTAVGAPLCPAEDFEWVDKSQGARPLAGDRSVLLANFRQVKSPTEVRPGFLRGPERGAGLGSR